MIFTLFSEEANIPEIEVPHPYQNVNAESLLQNVPEKSPEKGFSFIHSHTPKEQLLSPHSGKPLKSVSYQFIDHSPVKTTVRPSYGHFQETKLDYARVTTTDRPATTKKYQFELLSQ